MTWNVLVVAFMKVANIENLRGIFFLYKPAGLQELDNRIGIKWLNEWVLNY